MMQKRNLTIKYRIYDSKRHLVIALLVFYANREDFGLQQCRHSRGSISQISGELQSDLD